MSQTVRRPIEARYPSSYIPSRIYERRARTQILRLEQQGRPENPQDFVRYSHSDSEEETPTEQHRTLLTSYNFVDYVRSREIQAPEPRTVDQSYGMRHMATQEILRERPVDIGTVNKVFCSEWLSQRQIIFGTKCNKLLTYDVRTRSLDAITTLPPRTPLPGAPQCGIYTLKINPSRTWLATAVYSCGLGVYELPSMDPVCVGEGHTDWIFDMCWLDDEFLVTGSRDSKLALWRAPDTQATPHNYIVPLATRVCQTGEKIRAVTFNPRWREIAALSLNGYIHVFDAATFRQTFSQRLPRQNLFCLATQESRSLYAVGCEWYTLVLDCRTLQTVRKITSPNNVYGIRSASFRGDLLTMSSEAGLLKFYDVRAGKYLKSNLNPTRTIALRASRGYVPNAVVDGNQQVDDYVPAIYTHCYDDSGTRIFAAGGPHAAASIGNYAGIWQ